MREKMKTGEKENESVESRQWLVEGLRRHLVGPLATGDSASLGYTNTPKVVPALETFKEDGKRDIGALLDSDGRNPSRSSVEGLQDRNPECFENIKGAG